MTAPRLLKPPRRITRRLTRAAFFLALCAARLIYAEPLARFSEAEKLRANNDWYGATELYREAVNENPAYGDAWKGLAQCAYALDEYDLCLSYAERAALFLNEDADLQNLTAFALIGLGRLDEAGAIFENTLARYPNDVNARFGLAELDVFFGKTAAARDKYGDALKRRPYSRKALLSLALICGETGDIAAAKRYIASALERYGDDAQTRYYAAYLAALEGDSAAAEAYARAAIKLDDRRDEAYELLAAVLYSNGRWREAIDICDKRITRDRNSLSAWYLKAAALERLEDYEQAISVYANALTIFPEDDVTRASFESLIAKATALEDARREKWSAYHARMAKEYAAKNYSERALFEYRRALKINPYDVDVRAEYAAILLKQGLPARYLEQIRFAQSIGLSSEAASDAAESYASLLEDSLAVSWNYDPAMAERAHYRVGIYYQSAQINVAHPDAEKVTAELIADIMAHDGRFIVSADLKPVETFSEAFRRSRLAGEDYFGLAEFEENETDVKITLTLYVSRTGAGAAKLSSFRTGPDRYYSALRRLCGSLSRILPFRAEIVARSGKSALIDRGRADGVETDSRFIIVKKGTLSAADSGIALAYKPENALGVFTAQELDEELSAGAVARSGFYDRVTVGDEIIIEPAGDEDGDSAGALQSDDAARAPALLKNLRRISGDPR